MLLCGCCHAGLLNTLAHAVRLVGRPIEIVAGGLHLTSASDDELRHICKVLAEEPVLERIYPNHCTGEAAFVALTNALGASVVHPCPAGTVLELPV
jgi:7,8-dihydropterin-6-yl-methyl-4-(beta-D-ribofuranosyl)aminobenzene 5'-phosphate synthase